MFAKVDARRLGEDALRRGASGVVDDLCDLEQRLGGNASVEGAVAAEARFTLDERDMCCGRARRQRGDDAGRTAADDNDVVVPHSASHARNQVSSSSRSFMRARWMRLFVAASDRSRMSATS